MENELLKIIELQSTKEWKGEIERLQKELGLDYKHASMFQTARYYANEYCRTGQANKIDEMIDRVNYLYNETKDEVYKRIGTYLTNMLVMNF